MDELDKGLRISVHRSALDQFRTQAVKWGVILPSVAPPLVLDFGLSEFSALGID